LDSLVFITVKFIEGLESLILAESHLDYLLYLLQFILIWTGVFEYPFFGSLVELIDVCLEHFSHHVVLGRVLLIYLALESTSGLGLKEAKF
jgi:hypothetical protein